MAFNGTAVGTPTFAAAKFGNGLSASTDSNYISLPTGVIPTSAPFTWEAWLKTTATSTQVALSCAVDAMWFGILASGHFAIASVGGASLDSGIAINDGAWHHCVGIWDSGQVSTFVDGVAGATSTTSFVAPGSKAMFIGRFEATGFAWAGEIDEVAIWTIAKYSGSYTVPTAAYLGTESFLQALYHLESTGADSANPTSGSGTSFDPTNPAIVYSPFNWSVSTGYARTINAGAYFKTIFSGTSVSLTTDTSPNAAPYSEFWVRIDNGGWQLFSLASGSPTISLAIGLDGSKKHMLEVIVKATSEALNRWSSSQTILQFTSILLDASSTLEAPVTRTKRVLIFGDSITDGFRAEGVGTDIAGDNSLGSYAYALTTAMDAEVGVVGFGSQGVTVGGVGGVPALTTSYDEIYDGVARSFSSPAPDLVIYNMGTNDTASIASGLTSVIDSILSDAPGSLHLILVPFNGTHAAEIASVVSGLALPAVTSVNTTGWFNTADSYDGIHPYDYSGVFLLAPRLFQAVVAVLYSAGDTSGGGTVGGGGGGAAGSSYAFA